MDQEVERFGDVRRVIADALEVLRHEEQMRAGRDVARILDHVGQELAEEARIHLVELFVAQPDLEGLLCVALDIGVEHVLDHREADRAHARQRIDRLHRRRLVEHERALGDIRRVIADTLEIGRDLQRGDDLAKIARQRLAQREEPHDLRLDLMLQLVDLAVGFDHAGREIAVALRHRVDRGRELAFGHAAHLDDRIVEPLQLLVVALDDVFGDHWSSLLRFRQRFADQPNRPVM